MENPGGVPSVFLEAKKAEITKRQDLQQRIQLDIRRREAESRPKTVSRTADPVAEQSSVLPVIESSQHVPTVKGAVKTVVSSRRSRSPSSSPSPPRKRRDSPKKTEQVRPSAERVRQRRRSTRSSSASPIPNEQAIKVSGSRHRSRSQDSEDRAPKKPASDWRMDLMAGRRRSPPEMPENNYYGYEKHHKERKRSRERYRPSRSSPDRDGRRRRDDSGSRHFSPPQEQKRRCVHEPKRIEYEHRERDRVRRHNSPSPTPPKADDARYSVDHHRRPQRMDFCEIPTKHAKEYSEKRRDVRKRSPEGPSMPPVRFDRRATKAKPPSESSSSSDSSGEDSSSSSEDGSSSSTSGSDTDGQRNGENVSGLSPEGPQLPKSLVTEPEGPALPPSAGDEHEWIDNLPGSSQSSSSSSTSDSSGSDDSESDSSSAEDETEWQDSNKRPKIVPDKMSRKHSPSPRDRPVRSDHHKHRHGQAVPQKKSKERYKDEHSDNVEEDLRRRALASLMRASGGKRRARSPS